MFTQHCFIRKNTPELRAKLKELGWRENALDDFSSEWLAANYGMFISVMPGFEKYNPNDIDCGNNEELFLALAALRDNSDYMQYFICGGNFVLCDREDWLDMYSVLRSGNKYSIKELDNAYKANTIDIVTHFKLLTKRKVMIDVSSWRKKIEIDEPADFQIRGLGSLCRKH